MGKRQVPETRPKAVPVHAECSSKADTLRGRSCFRMRSSTAQRTFAIRWMDNEVRLSGPSTCRIFGDRTCVMCHQIGLCQTQELRAAVPIVCRTDAGMGNQSAVVLSGVVDSGRERGHGNSDAIDLKRALAVRFPSPTTPDHPADFGPTGVIATLTNRRFWTRPSSIDKALHSPSAPHTNFRLPIGKAPAKASLPMGSRSMSPLG